MKTLAGSLCSKLIFFALLFLKLSFVAHAQAKQETNKEISTSLEALQAANWSNTDSGFEYLDVTTSLNARIIAVKFLPQDYSISLLQQNQNTGHFVTDYAQRADALLAVNGGFFAERENGDLYSVGLLIDKGDKVSSAWRKKGGYLVLNENGIQILPTRTQPSQDALQVLQSKPVILEQGGKWALRSNSRVSKSRSLVCLLDDEQIVILSISGTGLSLYEAGWLLRAEDEGGFFDCASAIALDGGGSSQLFVKDMPSLDVYGSTKVPNALIVKAK